MRKEYDFSNEQISLLERTIGKELEDLAKLTDEELEELFKCSNVLEESETLIMMERGRRMRESTDQAINTIVKESRHLSKKEIVKKIVQNFSIECVIEK